MFQSPVIANLDGSADGTMEVIVKSHQTSDIFILDHDGNEVRRLNPNVHVTNGKDHNRSALTVADLDGDGQMEIIASYDSLGILYLAAGWNSFYYESILENWRY